MLLKVDRAINTPSISAQFRNFFCKTIFLRMKELSFLWKTLVYTLLIMGFTTRVTNQKTYKYFNLEEYIQLARRTGETKEHVKSTLLNIISSVSFILNIWKEHFKIWYERFGMQDIKNKKYIKVIKNDTIWFW